MPTTRVSNGLAWSPSWWCDHEGPFTRICKLAMVNHLSSAMVNRKVFGLRDVYWNFGRVHPRSLVRTDWIECAPLIPEGQELRAEIQQWSLSRFCDQTISLCIASDLRLRYCPTCLEQGFQSVIFQIDALAACPIHGDALRDSCPSCGAPTPRYAVAQDVFKAPMQCLACGSPFSGAWSRESMISAWSPVVRSDLFNEIEDWLRCISRQPLPDFEDETLSGLFEPDRRCFMFGILQRRYPLRLKCMRPRSER